MTHKCFYCVHSGAPVQTGSSDCAVCPPQGSRRSPRRRLRGRGAVSGTDTGIDRGRLSEVTAELLSFQLHPQAGGSSPAAAQASAEQLVGGARPQRREVADRQEVPQLGERAEPGGPQAEHPRARQQGGAPAAGFPLRQRQQPRPAVARLRSR